MYHDYDVPTDLEVIDDAVTLHQDILASYWHSLDPGPNLQGLTFSKSSPQTLAMSNCYLQSFRVRRRDEN